MRRRVSSVAAVTLLACMVGVAGPAGALSPGEGAFEPPGLDGRETHMTVLGTREVDCTELPIVRAVTWQGARELVPERYKPTMVVNGALVTGRFQMWDYVCEHLSVDGQSYAPRTQISIGAIAVTTRDGVPVSRGYYLLSLVTDNPVLAARYRQVGLPAAFARELSATMTDVTASPFEVSFVVPTAAYAITATGPSAPVPVPATDEGPNLFYEGGTGEVLLSYDNALSGTAATRVTADYRQHQILAPIIAVPRLLQPSDAPFAVQRGDWDAAVARLN